MNGTDNPFARIEAQLAQMRAERAEDRRKLGELALELVAANARFTALCAALGQDVLPGEAPMSAEKSDAGKAASTPRGKH